MVHTAKFIDFKANNYSRHNMKQELKQTSTANMEGLTLRLCVQLVYKTNI